MPTRENGQTLCISPCGFVDRRCHHLRLLHPGALPYHVLQAVAAGRCYAICVRIGAVGLVNALHQTVKLMSTLFGELLAMGVDFFTQDGE